MRSLMAVASRGNSGPLRPSERAQCFDPQGKHLTLEANDPLEELSHAVGRYLTVVRAFVKLFGSTPALGDVSLYHAVCERHPFRHGISGLSTTLSLFGRGWIVPVSVCRGGSRALPELGQVAPRRDSRRVWSMGTSAVIHGYSLAAYGWS